MPDVSFVGLLIVALVAFLAPLLLGLSPARRLPSVVIEIVAGIVIGPSVLGWVKVDLPISILSVIGLTFLLFLAGLEVELERLRGRGPPASNLTFVHRGSDPDRSGTRPDYEGDGRGAHRSRTALCPHLPDRCSDTLAS